MVHLQAAGQAPSHSYSHARFCYQFLTSMTVASITTRVREIPSEVFLSREDGLFEDCAVNLANLQTVPQVNIGALITTLSGLRLEEVQTAVTSALGFDALLP